MFAKKLFIGLDIGHFSVKAAIVGPNRRDIIDLAEMEINPGRTLIDEKSTSEQVAEAVRHTLLPYLDKNSKLNPSIVCALPGEGSVCRYLEIPRLDKNRQELAIQSAVMKDIPFPLEESFLTHVPVPVLNRESQNMGIFFFAFRKNATEALQEIVGRSGARIEWFDSPAASLIREFFLNHGTPADQCIALVHAGSSLTMIIVLHNGNPYFVREFATGGKDFTYAFQMGAQSTWREAEEYKYANDAASREMPIEPVLTRWMEQVRKTLAAFAKLEQSAALTVDRVHLAGGSARWKGLDSRLSKALHIPVTVETWEKIKPGRDYGQGSAGIFNIALGMAMQ
jgi:type IV pilus assembly protein PilM